MRGKDSKVHAIPDETLEALARRLYPIMVAFFESEEGQREFAEWQAQRDAETSPGRVAEPDEKIRLAG